MNRETNSNEQAYREAVQDVIAYLVGRAAQARGPIVASNIVSEHFKHLAREISHEFKNAA